MQTTIPIFQENGVGNPTYSYHCKVNNKRDKDYEHLRCQITNK